MKKYLCTRILILIGAIFLITSPPLSAAEDFVRFGPAGELIINDNIKCEIRHYGPNWALQNQNKRSVKLKIDNEESNRRLVGFFTTKTGEKFNLEEKLKFISKAEFDFEASLKAPSGIETEQLCMAIIIPVKLAKSIKIDDKEIVFPISFKKMSIYNAASAKKFVYQLPKCRLVMEGDFNISIQDNRRFKSNSFTIRFNFTPTKGKLKDSSISMKIRKEYLNASTIDISNVVNMGFKDDIANDKKGGWTDQGPSNDLRMLQTGKKRFGGVPFNVIDPTKNNGKSCLAMYAQVRSHLPKSVEIEGKGNSYNYLYFLHTAAWAGSKKDYGVVEVCHRDGTISKFNVKGKRDVSDWWGCYPLENGAVVWTGENKSSYVGLFMSKFKIADKPISKIKISSTGDALWMIVGLSGTKENIPLPKDEYESYIIPGKDWQPFKHSLNVVKDSALDLSFMTEAPAGKYGRVFSKDGQYRFEKRPDQPVRFYGANLCFSANYLEKDESEELADRLIAYGYNSIRIHHYDRSLIDNKAKDSLTILKDKMDKLDYLFYCLKKRGIYITTDVFVSRNVKASEVKELSKDTRYIKALAPISDDVMNNIKEFSKRFLTHVNPYTGIAWKDDPALFTISFINENALAKIWDKHLYTTQAYETAFKKWATENHIQIETTKEKSSAFTQFIINMQIKSYEVLRKYIKDELGCKALYSDTNMRHYITQALARDKFDYVDNHAYWDHPKFTVKSWSFPISFHNKSVLPKYCSVPTSLMPTRILGKPFSLTEFNYVFPNKFRAEGNPVMGALASLQDWGALYRFDFAQDRKRATTVTPASDFGVSSDPLTLLGERIIALMFRRRDVKVAEKVVPFLVTPDCAKVVGTENGSGEEFPIEYEKLGLIHRLGSIVIREGLKLPKDSDVVISAENIDKAITQQAPLYKSDKPFISEMLEDGILKKEYYNPETGSTLSDTGEIRLNPQAKTFSVVTEKTESFVLPAGLDGKGKVLNVSENTTFATIFASSLDQNSLKDSKRILILHLTDIKNTKTKFINSQHTSMLAAIGPLPHLVRSGKAKIDLAITRDELPTLWALDVTGKRIEKVKVEKTEKGISFNLSTIGKGNTRMAYELVW